MALISINYFSPLEFKTVQKQFNIAGVKNYAVKDKKGRERYLNDIEKCSKQSYSNDEKVNLSSGVDIWA